MRTEQAWILAGLVLAGCVAGREGVLDSEGGLVRRDGSFGSRDGAVSGDGAAELDGASLDGAARDDGSVLRDGSIARDGSLPLFELACDDGVDNDGDGTVDCADDDCAEAPCDAAGNSCSGGVCGGCRGEPSETLCGDGADEDCDGLTDCADPDCAGVTCGPDVVCGGGTCPCPSGFVERACGDGTDDDCDGLIDCADPDCEGRGCGASGFVCTAGSCTCMGSVDLCNDLDEDCDGVVDDGCPSALTLCCPSSAGGYGSGGGTTFTDPCPSGTVLMGIAGRASTRLDRILPICAPLVLETDREARPEFAYPIRRGAPILGSTHGGTGGTAFDDRCPGDDVVIGVRGTNDELGAVRSIAIECGTVSAARFGLSFRLSITPSTVTPTRGSAGTESFAADCPSGAITDVAGSAGTTVSRLSFTCRQLRLETR